MLKWHDYLFSFLLLGALGSAMHFLWPFGAILIPLGITFLMWVRQRNARS